MLVDKTDLTTCSLRYVFSAVGGKWKPFIIWYLWSAPEGMCRYGKLKREIPWNISHKMFVQQLRELERDGIVERTIYEGKQMRVEYRLTEAGKLLAPAILYLRDWGAAFGAGFTSEDLVDRTLGIDTGGSLKYGYKSVELKKSVQVEFEY